MINTHNGIKEKGIKPIDISDYSAIKKYLDKFYPQLEKRIDKGITPYHLRNCAYMDDFNRQKIMYPDIVEKLSFCFVDDEMYCNNSVYLITSKTESLRHLLNFLNSDVINWYYKKLSVQLGDSAVRMFSIYVLNIPIPKAIVENDVYKSYGLSKEEIEYIQFRS